MIQPNLLKIEGVFIKELKQFQDERGSVLHMLKSNDINFNKFGEVYFSEILPGKIKAWKYHKKMTLNLFVIQGKVKFVFFDNKKSFVKLILSEHNYKQVSVRPKVWFGFKGLGKKNRILNFSNITHSTNEVMRKRQEDIFFKW